jgi:hypothetical protein
VLNFTIIAGTKSGQAGADQALSNGFHEAIQRS